MTELYIEDMPVLGTHAVAEQMSISAPYTTALQTLATRKHGTLAHMLRDLPLDGAPPGCSRSDKRRLWGLRLRSIGRGNMLSTVENLSMHTSIISALISVGIFAVYIFSLFGDNPAFYLSVMGLCMAAVGFVAGKIGYRAMEMGDGWMNEFRKFPSQYTNFIQSPELQSFIHKVQKSRELKQGDVESYLSQEDSMALLRLHAIVRWENMEDCRYVVLDADARELLVRAGDALENARNGFTQDKTVMITAKRLNDWNHTGNEAS